MIHNANHLRPKRDGLKVGGHQASSASVATLMTALYFDVLTPADRVAVKPHASPIYHAIQYLLGRQTRERLERFRALGGAQSYPSRTKDVEGVDFSTGSVGLGVAMTTFAALVQDYLRLKNLAPHHVQPGRMVAIVGDAELDEGNVFEALLEGWKHDVRNLWWIVDYNRQSLDAVVPDRLFGRFDTIFRDMGWRVITLKYGRLLEAAFAKPGGEALREWIDACPNSTYSALAYQGGAAWRSQLMDDLGRDQRIADLVAVHEDGALGRLMTNLGGHDLKSVLEAFHSVTDDRPTCFLAYTIKGAGLPFAGHKDNHAGLMTPAQVEALQQQMGIREGEEWEPFAGLGDRPLLEAFLAEVPFNQHRRRTFVASRIPVPERLESPAGARLSTQEAFGRLLATIARQHPDLASRVVTTAPDVTVSTNLGSWVNRRGIFHREAQAQTALEASLSSPQAWTLSPHGQHIELGIAENNLFLLLAALGLSAPIFGTRLLPIGTVYDPFIARGLDALNYACYQDARFLLAGTPAGLALAPEGGAHQSVYTPLVGIGQPGLTAFEPAFVDELTEITRWSLEHLQDEVDGGAVYLRLSTRPIDQVTRTMTGALRSAIVEGGYWLAEPADGAEIAIVCAGTTVQEALEAHRIVSDDLEGVGLMVVTSADRLQHGWLRSQQARSCERTPSHVEHLLARLAPRAGLVTVLDGHPSTLAWMGAVAGHRIVPLGVDRFGQSGDLPDLYAKYGIDADSIVGAVARLLR